MEKIQTWPPTCLAALDGWTLVWLVIVPKAARFRSGCCLESISSLFVFLRAKLDILSASLWIFVEDDVKADIVEPNG